MRSQKIFVAGLAFVFAFAFGLITSFAQENAPKSKNPQKPPAKSQDKTIMPKEIEAILQEGMPARQGRQDIPFSIFKNIVYPAQGNCLYPLFFFRAKNSAFDFGPAAGTPSQLEPRARIYLLLFKADEKGNFKPQIRAATRLGFKSESASFDPDKEDWYSFGLPLPVGKYVLSMALTSPDLKKIGVGYYDFELPGPESYKSSLMISEPLIYKSIEEIQPEKEIMVHRGLITWGGLEVIPLIPETVSLGEDLNMVFFIYGAAPAPQKQGQRPQYDIEIAYEVQKENGEAAAKWSPQTYQSYFINQEFPLVQTLLIKDAKGEHQERKPLTAGKFILSFQIKDKISGLSVERKLPFEIK